MKKESARTKLFISNSRKDAERVEQLHDMLALNNQFQTLRDTRDILPSEEWKARLEGLIRSSDAVLFIMWLDGDNIKQVCKNTTDAIALDIDWKREHMRLGELADRWKKSRAIGAQPLHGAELNAPGPRKISTRCQKFFGPVLIWSMNS